MILRAGYSEDEFKWLVSSLLFGTFLLRFDSHHEHRAAINLPTF